jgi:hypothetical protein
MAGGIVLSPVLPCGALRRPVEKVTEALRLLFADILAM